MTLTFNLDNPSQAPKYALLQVTRSKRKRDDFAHENELRDLRRALHPHVRRLLRKYGGGNGDIDDIVQEALLAFHTERDSLDPKAPILPWLYAVARNKAIDATRRRNRWARTAAEASFEPASVDSAFACEKDDVFSLLSLLSDREQGILRHTSLEGLTVAEAARHLGVSKVHARVIKHRAIRKLSSMLGRTGSRISDASRQGNTAEPFAGASKPSLLETRRG